MPMNFRIFATLSLLVASPVFAETTPQPAEPVWAYETSDIELDPGFVFGQLDNGMRYIIRENATPEGTALVRMRIGSGSLDETDRERGLAHFVEHMAFNGSTNIPEGEMVKLLEREGLAFGADTNASTGFETTTYMLNLPRNDDDLLDTALMLMRETASEITIAEDAVERERGVILAERRDRRGFAQKATEDSLAFIAPGARFVNRLPIGTLDVLQTATAADLRGFYKRTYVPTNTVLVIVGDYPIELMEAKIRERFANWQGAPDPVEPETGPVDMTRTGQTDIYIDPALSETVAISRLGPWQDEPDTLANRVRSSKRGIGYAIINRRLARLARAEDAPFKGARFGTGNVFEDARSTSLSISSTDGDWRAGLLAAVREVNQALTFGFTQAEVNEQLANQRTTIENAVAAEATRTNAAYVRSALNLATNEIVPTTPAYRLELFNQFEPMVTPQSVHSALLEHALSLEQPLIRFQGRMVPEGGEEALRLAFEEGLAAPIAAPENADTAQFAYTDFGAPGVVVSDEVDDRLGIRKITFANGVRLNLKQTDIRKDRISVRMALDGGNLLNTRENPLRTYLVGSLAAGGLGQHSQDELATILAGKSVRLGFGSGSDAFTFSAGTTPRDLELQLQLVAAMLTDPGYRPEGVARFRKNIDNFFANLDSTPARALNNRIGGILSDDDPRFSLQPKHAFFALDYATLEQDIGDRLANGAIELAIVGDIEEQAAINAVATTLGALPPREADFLPREDARERSFTTDRAPRELTHSGEADQALLRMYWPTRDDSDLEEDLQLSLLGRVVRIQLQEQLREDLGKAYSPSAGSSTSRIYRGYGTFSIAASVDLAEVDATREAVLTMLSELAAKPLDQDTIDRARQPLLEAYDNALKSLGGWMRLTSRIQSQPDRLERWFAAPDILKAIKPKQIQQVAARYLAVEQALEVLVVPNPEVLAAAAIEQEDQSEAAPSEQAATSK